MRLLSLVFIVLAIVFAFSWISIYSRDSVRWRVIESERVDNPIRFGGMVVAHVRTYLYEGYIDLSIYVPPCVVFNLTMYRAGFGDVVYSAVLMGEDKKVLRIHVPEPGIYIVRIEAKNTTSVCNRIVNGVINLVQEHQSEENLRLYLAIATVVSIIIGLANMLSRRG